MPLVGEAGRSNVGRFEEPKVFTVSCPGSFRGLEGGGNPKGSFEDCGEISFGSVCSMGSTVILLD